MMNCEVSAVYNSYPQKMRESLLYLRELIYEVASDEEDEISIEETLKWNEPSYLTPNGSTIRLAWRKSKPEEYGIFFNCKTKLIPTFRELFSDRFSFEGDRAILFKIDDKIAIKELKYCILLSLTYHCRKHLTMLDE